MPTPESDPSRPPPIAVFHDTAGRSYELIRTGGALLLNGAGENPIRDITQMEIRGAALRLDRGRASEVGLSKGRVVVHLPLALTVRGDKEIWLGGEFRVDGSSVPFRFWFETAVGKRLKGSSGFVYDKGSSGVTYDKNVGKSARARVRLASNVKTDLQQRAGLRPRSDIARVVAGVDGSAFDVYVELSDVQVEGGDVALKKGSASLIRVRQLPCGRPEDGWDLTLEIPAGIVRKTWNASIADHVIHGLSDVRSRQQLSFVPQFKDETVKTGALDGPPWLAHYRGAAGAKDLASFEAVQLVPGAAPPNAPQFTLLFRGIHKLGGGTLDAVVSGNQLSSGDHEKETPSRSDDKRGASSTREFKPRPGTRGPIRFRIVSGDLCSNFLGVAGGEGVAPIFQATVSWPISKVRPGGQDDVLLQQFAEEGDLDVQPGCLAENACGAAGEPYEDEFEPPLVIPLHPIEQKGEGSAGRKSGGSTDEDNSGSAEAVRIGALELSFDRLASQPSPAFVLNVEETNGTIGGRTNDHTVRLKLRSRTPVTVSSGAKPRVLVIDREPFLVAAVQHAPFDQLDAKASSPEIAHWSNASAEGAGWQVLGGLETFSLILPPQAVGEAMLKAREIPDEAAAPVEYRFSPPAEQRLFSSYFEQRYADPPWNLRRVLGYPGQRAPGAGVQSLQYELLYGLSCHVDFPHLRLAEISALLGRTPPRRLRPAPAWVVARGQEAAYAVAVRAWKNLHRQLRSRLALYEPWDERAFPDARRPDHQRRDLALRENVSCHLRPSADLYYKANPTTSDDEFDVEPQGLKGGVTWGFESPRIYHASVRNPRSTSALLIAPYFSALGGWGSQRVGFDRDLTQILSTSVMGRNASYTIERLGRIGVFWNRAKHVIVYERTVRPTDQFYNYQSAQQGRPMLRKVREYVELLEPERTYPEDVAAPALPRGFVRGISFKTIQINVNSSWGSNVGDEGWKVPLWNPDVQDENERRAYPKPQVFLRVAADEPPTTGAGNDKPEDAVGRARTVECELREPQKLVFYTRTKKDPNAVTGVQNEPPADPNDWLATLDVDFTDLPMPYRRPAFATAGVRPGALPTPLGYENFTFELSPGPLPVNVVAERGTTSPMGAAIQNVTMLRSVAKVAPADASQASGAGVLQQSLDTIAGQADAIVRAARDATQGTQAVDNAIKAAAAQANDLRSKIQNICINANTTLANNALAEALKRLQDEERQVLTAFETELTRRLAEIESQLRLDRLKTFLDTPRRDAEIALRDELSTAFETWIAQINTLPMQPQSAFRLLHDAERMLEGLASTLEEDRIRSLGIKVAKREVGGKLDSVRSQARVLAQRLGSAVPIPWGAIDHALQMTSAAVAKVPEVDDQIDELIRACKFLVDTLKPLQTALPELQRTLGLKASDTVPWLSADLHLHLQHVMCEGLDILHESPLQALEDDFHAFISRLTADVTRGLNQLRTDLGAIGVDHLKPLTSAGEAACTALNKEIDKLIAQLSNWLVESPTAKQLRAVLDDLQARLQAEAQTALDAGRKAVEEVFKGISVPDAYQVGNSAIALARAFGNPPKVPQLEFDTDVVGYFFDPSKGAVAITSVQAQVDSARDWANQVAGATQGILQPLGLKMPTEDIFNELLPAGLQHFDIADVLPDFAGIKLAGLFENLKLPEIANDRVKVRHGLDPQTRRGWVQTDIHLPMEQPTTIFAFGPLKLQLVNAVFDAHTRIEQGLSGGPIRKVEGKLSGDWVVGVEGNAVVTLMDTTLSFDENRNVRFDVQPAKVKLHESLRFVSDLLASFVDPASGFSIGLLPDGVQSILELPIPPIQGLTSGASGLHLSVLFALRLADPEMGEFSLSLGFGLGRPERPFNIAIFILGGAGHVLVTAKYAPGSRKLVCALDIGIAASASLAISLGPISGGVYVFLGVTVHYSNADAGKGLVMGIEVIIRGEVNVLAIASASITLSLRGRYEHGVVVATGRLQIEIKICWCFTLSVDQQVEYRLAAGSGSSSLDEPARWPRMAMAGAFDASVRSEAPNLLDRTVADAVADNDPWTDYLEAAGEYVDMLA